MAVNRAPALRNLLAVEPLFPDEIFDVMGGQRLHVLQAIAELKRSGELDTPGGPKHFRCRYRLTPKGRAAAFGGAHA